MTKQRPAWKPKQRPALRPKRRLGAPVPSARESKKISGSDPRPCEHPRACDSDSKTFRDKTFHDKTFHEKQMADMARFKLSVETDFWFAICFRTGEEKDAFLRGTGWGALYGRWEGEALVQYGKKGLVPGAYPLTSKRRAKTRVPSEIRRERMTIPDPLETMVYEDDVEGDPARELEILLSVISRYEREACGEYWEPVKSAHFVPVLFQCIEHKERFLAQVGWGYLGNKYLDGVEMAALFGLEMPVYEVGEHAPPGERDHRYINGYWLGQVHGLEMEFVHLPNREVRLDPDWKRLSFM